MWSSNSKQARDCYASLLLHFSVYRTGPRDLRFFWPHCDYTYNTSEPDEDYKHPCYEFTKGCQLLLQLSYYPRTRFQWKCPFPVSTSPLYHNMLAMVYSDAAPGSLATDHHTSSDVGKRVSLDNQLRCHRYFYPPLDEMTTLHFC